MGDRYIFNIAKWEVTEDELKEAVVCNLDNAEDRTKVLRFHFLVDKKRAYISRLMARKLSYRGIGVDQWIGQQIADTSKFGPESVGADGKLLNEAAVRLVREYYETDQNYTPDLLDVDVTIRRTEWGKPFLSVPTLKHTNFNFNISHEGDFVVGASDFFCPVGVDVAAPREARGSTGKTQLTVVAAFDQTRQDFGTCLSELEWAYVEGWDGETPSNNAIIKNGQAINPNYYNRFMRIWSLKEAFVKARGDGLGFELINCEFQIVPLHGENTGSMKRSDTRRQSITERDVKSSITIGIDENSSGYLPQPQWNFSQHVMQDHWISVARGPISAIQEDPDRDYGVFRKRFIRSKFSESEWRSALDLPHVEFETVDVDDLLRDIS